MKWIRSLGGWSLSMAAFAPILPQQCEGLWFPPNQSNGGAGAAGSPMTAGVAGVLQSGGSGALAGNGNLAGSPQATGGSSVTAAGGSTGGTTSGGGVAGTGATSAVCGNGALEPGEICDEGAANGSYDHCDVTCTFFCAGNCPLRVDPAAAVEGSGRDWSDPRQQLADAIAYLSNRGGGVVWLKAGTYGLYDIIQRDELLMASDVHVLGGFDGTEKQRSERLLGRTRLVGRGVPASLVRISSAFDVFMDRIDLVNGEPNFTIENSSFVQFRDVRTESSSLEVTENVPTVSSSEARFESCTFSLPRNLNGLRVIDSNVAFVDSVITAPPYVQLSGVGGSVPRLYAQGGHVLLQRSRVESGAAIGVNAEAFILESTLLNGEGIGPALQVEGSVALVANTFGSGRGYPSVWVNTGGWAIVFESSFDHGYTTAPSGNFPAAWAIGGPGNIEVSLSTFGSGVCDYSRSSPCPAIEAASVDNSLFLPGDPAQGVDAFPAAQLAIGGQLPPSNCAIYASRRPLGTHPCADGGNEALLSESYAHLFAFAAPFQSIAILNVDLSRYQPESFWRNGVVLPLERPCGDSGAPDPGYHDFCAP